MPISPFARGAVPLLPSPPRAAAMLSVPVAILTLLRSHASRRRVAPSRRAIIVSRVLNADPQDLWPVMTDAELYARLAPNLSRVTAFTAGPDGKPGTRRCWDVRGRHWDESCTLWDEGQAFAVNVHTAAADYPYPLAALTGTWTAEPLPLGRTRVTMRFEMTPRAGATGAAFAAAMTAAAHPMARRILSGWEREARQRRSNPPTTATSQCFSR